VFVGVLGRLGEAISVCCGDAVTELSSLRATVAMGLDGITRGGTDMSSSMMYTVGTVRTNGVSGGSLVAQGVFASSLKPDGMGSPAAPVVSV
jgi:hypothetical protein